MLYSSHSRISWPHRWLSLAFGNLLRLSLAITLLFLLNPFDTRPARATGPLYVETWGVDAGDCTASACATIQYAIGQAAPGDTICVHIGTYGSINITQSVTISGGWTLFNGPTQSGTLASDGQFSNWNLSSPTTASCPNYVGVEGRSIIDPLPVLCGNFPGGSGNRRVYVAPGVNATIENFVIQKGCVSYRFIFPFPPVGDGRGGGMLVDGSLTIANSLIISNTAVNGSGGGVYNNGTLTVIDSSVYNNTTGSSGGGVFNNGLLTVINSSIYNNTASGSGSGVFNSSAGVITMSNSSLSNNTFYNDGGRVGSDGGITGDVTNNNGSFRPSPSLTTTGSLNIIGTFMQTSGGALQFLLAGPTPATQFDQLNVVGPVVLAGSLQVSLTTNFTPTLGQTFRIINYTSRTGTFSGVSILAMPTSMFMLSPLGGTRPLRFEARYDSDGVTLVTLPPLIYLPMIRR